MFFALLLTLLAAVYIISVHEEPVPEKIKEREKNYNKRSRR